MQFENIRHALEEHLSAINENTSEIQALFDYLHELDVKIEKLTQRMDSVQLSECDKKPSIMPLNHLEKKVFLVLYTQEQALSWNEISQKSELSISLVQECLSTLAQKGVPLHRSFVSDHIFFKLDPTFKEMQAKEKLINLSLQSFMKN